MAEATGFPTPATGRRDDQPPTGQPEICRSSHHRQQARRPAAGGAGPLGGAGSDRHNAADHQSELGHDLLRGDAGSFALIGWAQLKVGKVGRSRLGDFADFLRSCAVDLPQPSCRTHGPCQLAGRHAIPVRHLPLFLHLPRHRHACLFVADGRRLDGFWTAGCGPWRSAGPDFGPRPCRARRTRTRRHRRGHPHVRDHRSRLGRLRRTLPGDCRIPHRRHDRWRWRFAAPTRC